MIAKRWPSWGGVVAALPLTSILAFIVPSIPMFIAIPLLLKNGVPFWITMAISVAAMFALYALSFFTLAKLGFKV